MTLTLDHLRNQHCFFFFCPDWVFSTSLLEDTSLWGIADQIYLRQRRHQSFSFVLPYLVCELGINNSNERIRLFLIYGNDVSAMIGSVNQFLILAKGMKAWVTQLDFDLNLITMADLANRLLESRKEFTFAHFFRYHEPHHRTLTGYWEQVL